MLSTEELLRKAVLSVTDGNPGGLANSQPSDFGGSGQAALSIEQVTTFIELMAAQQVMLGDVRTVTSSAAKWNESIIQFAGRIAKPGTEGVRLPDSTGEERETPETGIVEMSTVLLRAEVPVSDETFEDNVAGQALVQNLERLIADRFGFDIEDLFINADPAYSGSASDQLYYRLLPNGGWVYQAINGSPSNVGGSGNAVDGSSYGQDYQEIFRVLLETMPDRFRRGLEQDGRFYIPKRTEVKYRDILASRGTPLGDLQLTGKGDLTYQGIDIVGVPALKIAAGKSHFLLCNRNNLYAGYHRAMKFETWRDPREGATSFITTARVDAEVAIPDATVCAHDVDVAI